MGATTEADDNSVFAWALRGLSTFAPLATPAEAPPDNVDMPTESAAPVGPPLPRRTSPLRGAALRARWESLTPMVALQTWLDASVRARGALRFPGRPPQPVPAWSAEAWETPPATWPQAPGIQQLLVDGAVLAAGPRRVARELRSLADLRRLLLAWLVPERGTARFADAVPVAFLWHVTGHAQFLLEARAQLARGGRPARNAGRKLVGLPADVVRALRAGLEGPDRKRVFLRWLYRQAAGVAGATRPEAAVYVMCSSRFAYIGVTSHHHRHPGVRRLGLPDARHVEHLRDDRAVAAERSTSSPLTTSAA